jgi:hypothetical protein
MLYKGCSGVQTPSDHLGPLPFGWYRIIRVFPRVRTPHLGRDDGGRVGDLVGDSVGPTVGSLVGAVVGPPDGDWDGAVVGACEGREVGRPVGRIEGPVVGACGKRGGAERS